MNYSNTHGIFQSTENRVCFPFPLNNRKCQERKQTNRTVSVFAWGRIFKGAAPPEGMAATQAGDPEEVPPKPLPPHTLLKAFFPALTLGSAKKRNPFSTTRLVEALSTCSSLFLSITEPQCYLQHKWPV